MNSLAWKKMFKFYPKSYVQNLVESIINLLIKEQNILQQSFPSQLFILKAKNSNSGCSLSYLLVFSQQPSTRLLNFLLCIQHYIFNVTVNNFTFFLFQNTNDINKFDILTVIFLVQHL